MAEDAEGSQPEVYHTAMTIEQHARHRLVTARGHLEAVMRMVDDGRPCTDVVHQIAAVQGVLAAARRHLIESHLRDCVAPSIVDGNIGDVVDDLLAVVFGGEPEALSSRESPPKPTLSNERRRT